MNVGYLIAARIFDYVRQTLGEHGHLTLFGFNISDLSNTVLVSLGFEFLLFPTIYFLRRGAEATDEGRKFDAEPERYVTARFRSASVLTVRDSARRHHSAIPAAAWPVRFLPAPGVSSF